MEVSVMNGFYSCSYALSCRFFTPLILIYINKVYIYVAEILISPSILSDIKVMMYSALFYILKILLFFCCVEIKQM